MPQSNYWTQAAPQSTVSPVLPLRLCLQALMASLFGCGLALVLCCHRRFEAPLAYKCAS